ncbi:MAG: Uma2 family endonuclease [Pyrinomonadaceae bacterium]
MSAQIKPQNSLEDYFELERTSDERWEWFNGRVFCMSGVSPTHDQIEGNFGFLLRSELRDRDCRVFAANIRIKVPAAPPYRYADLSALSGTPLYEEIGGVEAVTNPSVLIEILSPSTEAYDRGDKFSYYKSIPTLQEYVLVAQHRPHVSQFLKQESGVWKQTEVNDLDASVYLPSIECKISLNDLYAGVEFGPAAPTLVSPEEFVR